MSPFALRDLAATALGSDGPPGLACSVVRHGQPAITVTVGSTAAGGGPPITDRTVFEAASLGKPVFALAVLRLVARREFDLDIPLGALLEKPYAPDDPRHEQITARHVLSHRSGLPNWFVEGKPRRLLRAPGEAFTYSGEGYRMLQLALGRVTGEPFEATVAREVFQPAAMRESAFLVPDLGEESIAHGHQRARAPMEPVAFSVPLAAATLFTTIRDYSHFTAYLLANDTELNGMLGRETAVAPSISWGLGWGIEHPDGSDAFFHWGHNPGFRHIVVGLPHRGLALTVLTNGEDGFAPAATLVREVLGEPRPCLDWVASFDR